MPKSAHTLQDFYGGRLFKMGAYSSAYGIFLNYNFTTYSLSKICEDYFKENNKEKTTDDESDLEIVFQDSIANENSEERIEGLFIFIRDGMNISI